MKQILLLLFLLISSHGFGQKVYYSPKHVSYDQFENIKVIGQNEKGIFTLQSNLPFELNKDRIGLRNRKYRVNYFDLQLNKLWDLNPEEKSIDMDLESIDFFNSNILLTHSISDKSDNSYALFAQYINDKSNSEAGIKSVGKFKVENVNAVDKALVASSLNKNFIAIMLQEEKGDEINAHISICDSSLNLVRQLTLIFPYKWKDFSIKDFKISNNADLVVLGYIGIRSKESKKQRIYKYHLFTCLQDETTFVEQNIHDENVYAAEAGLSIDEFNQQVVVAGLYASNQNFHASGIFTAKLKLNNGEQLRVKQVQVSDEAQKELVGERSFKSGSDISNYPVRMLIPRNDGGLLLVTESEYVYQYSSYDYFSQTFIIRNEFYLDNILLLSISNDNKIEWSKSIRKNQYSMDDNAIYSSFIPMLTSGEIGFIYNQEISRFTSINGYLINSNGTSTNVNLVKPSERVLLFPGWGKQVSLNQLVIPVRMKNKLFLSRISF
ncbi:MAG TPA: hypothetical protein PKH65_01175 [Bacteroidia bacterium]|nr:hypothetical protein [Bacteroidia bacterium]HNT79265.1 hypothetical protein [Bacteroidia bacterium]